MDVARDFGGGWIVAITHPQREMYAGWNAEKQGYQCYIPRFRERLSRKLKVLFPNYIFVYSTGQWTSLLSTYGVRNIILGELGPRKVPETIIRDLRRNEDNDGVLTLPLEKFSRGQEVRIKSGHFMNQVGIYEGLKGRDRVRILLDVLGGSTIVTLKETQIEDV